MIKQLAKWTKFPDYFHNFPSLAEVIGIDKGQLFTNTSRPSTRAK